MERFIDVVLARGIVMLLVVTSLVASGCAAGGDDSASDWEQRRGSDWSEYEAAFKDAWREGCERAGTIGRTLVEKTASQSFTPPVCDPAAAPDDPPDIAPLDPGPAGRTDGFVAGLVSGCGALPGVDRERCVSLGGEG